jgi:hypothetical protein
VTLAPARRQRAAAALQPTLVQERSPKGVRHATSQRALSNVSAPPQTACNKQAAAAALEMEVVSLMHRRLARG